METLKNSARHLKSKQAVVAFRALFDVQWLERATELEIGYLRASWFLVGIQLVLNSSEKIVSLRTLFRSKLVFVESLKTA